MEVYILLLYLFHLWASCLSFVYFLFTFATHKAFLPSILVGLVNGSFAVAIVYTGLGFCWRILCFITFLNDQTWTDSSHRQRPKYCWPFLNMEFTLVFHTRCEEKGRHFLKWSLWGEKKQLPSIIQWSNSIHNCVLFFKLGGNQKQSNHNTSGYSNNSVHQRDV